MSQQQRLDLRQQARNLRRAGNSLGMIVKALGIPKTTIQRWVTSRDGPEARPPNRPAIFIPSSPDAGRQASGGQFVQVAGTVPSSAPAWQMPNVYVNSIQPSAPSTMIIPYPVEQSQPDSIGQVMLDLIRAKGFAMVDQQHQPQTQQYQPQPPPATKTPDPEGWPAPCAKSRDSEDWMNMMRAKVDDIGRTLEMQEQEREEGKLKRLKALQEDFDQFWKKLESKQSEPETTKEKTGSTENHGQNDSKNDPSGLPAGNNTGVVVTGLPVTPSSPIGADTARARIPLDLPKSPLPPNPQPPIPPPIAESTKPEFPQNVDSNKHNLESTDRQTHENKQNSIGNRTVPGQLPAGAPSETFASPKDENQQSNGASTDQSNGLRIFQPAPVEPGVNHDLRNTVLFAGVLVGIGVAALYKYNPQVKQRILSEYHHIFPKASQSKSDGMSTQPQQDSNASTQGYPRVNDPNGVAFF